MRMNNRDVQIIRHILNYCEEVYLARMRFGDDREVFMADPVYRNAVSMPVQQIGELAKHLSDEFIEANPGIPWKQIKGMRTWFAHQYLNMDVGSIWDVVQEGVPPLKDFCVQWLQDVAKAERDE